MQHFFDPSIKPIVTTDLDGNILYVRTYGLHHYGYPDIIMEQDFSDYEVIFYALIDKIFCLKFNINDSWNYNGKIFKLNVGQDGLARINVHEEPSVRIITILNPVTEKPAKYITKGLTSLYNHPEAEIDGEVIYANEVLAFLVEQVKGGFVYDEDCSIFFDEYCFDIFYNNDRYGNEIIQVNQKEQTIDISKKTSKKSLFLERVK